MKAEVIVDNLEASMPDVREDEKELLTQRLVLVNGVKVPRFFWKLGAVIDRPDSHRLVGLGVAKPADDECATRAAQWTKNWPAVLKARDRLAAGIHPEDFELFDRGYIAGYEGDGSYKPGPKWDEYQALLAAEDEDEDDE